MDAGLRGSDVGLLGGRDGAHDGGSYAGKMSIAVQGLTVVHRLTMPEPPAQYRLQ